MGFWHLKRSHKPFRIWSEVADTGKNLKEDLQLLLGFSSHMSLLPHIAVLMDDVHYPVDVH